MNKYNPNIHNRKSIRLKGYDYSQAGLYFITICVKNRECLFGEIVGASLVGALVDAQIITYTQIKLNDAGKMIKNEWLKLSERFKNIKLHEYTVMPNHFHAILEIVGATLVVGQNDNSVGQNDNSDIGQPQGQPGQPQGIAPTGKTVGGMFLSGIQNVLICWMPAKSMME